MTQFRIGLAVLLTALSSIPAYSAPIRYSEELNGDLPDPRIGCCTPDWGQQVTLTAGLGRNEIHGSTIAYFPYGSPAVVDYDPFGFVIPDGLVLQSARLAYHLTAVANVLYSTHDVELFGRDSSDGFLVGGVDRIILVSDDGFPADVDESPVHLFGELNWLDEFPPHLLPFPADVWRFYPHHGSTSVAVSGLDTLVSMDYRFYLDVRQVPGPGALALFGLGLAGLGLSRRHKAR